MSEDEEKTHVCEACESCYTCQVGDVPVSELRKYQSTTIEYLDPKECVDIEEYLRKRKKGVRDALEFKETLARIDRKKQRDPLIEFLKYIFFFKWLKVTWK